MSYRSSTVKRRALEALRGVNYCSYCGQNGTREIGPDGRPWHLDHVIPLHRGGTDTLENIVRSCARCNISKGTKLIVPRPEAIRACGTKQIDFVSVSRPLDKSREEIMAIQMGRLIAERDFAREELKSAQNNLEKVTVEMRNQILLLSDKIAVQIKGLDDLRGRYKTLFSLVTQYQTWAHEDMNKTREAWKIVGPLKTENEALNREIDSIVRVTKSFAVATLVLGIGLVVSVLFNLHVL